MPSKFRARRTPDEEDQDRRSDIRKMPPRSPLGGFVPSELRAEPDQADDGRELAEHRRVPSSRVVAERAVADESASRPPERRRARRRAPRGRRPRRGGWRRGRLGRRTGCLGCELVSTAVAMLRPFHPHSVSSRGSSDCDFAPTTQPARDPDGTPNRGRAGVTLRCCRASVASRPGRPRDSDAPCARHSRVSRSGGTRTPDRWFWKPLLYQLSYAPSSGQWSLVIG